jgi:hypothetical protein
MNCAAEPTVVFPGSFDKDELQPYIDYVDNHYNSYVESFPDKWDSWEARALNITGDPIGQKVAHILSSRLKIELVCSEIHIQLWPEGCCLTFHSHDMDVNWADRSVYNSMLYLNDDFAGGEFITEQGIKIEPRAGTLSFFNGNHIKHGIAPFYGNRRYTIIFWWDKQSYWI